jgi:tetratricopeptide (TPR) repeat protein
MKHIFIILACCSILSISYAQKLNKEGVGGVYYEMPPLEMTIQSYSTFTTKHDAPASSLNSNLLPIINENAKLIGFTKVNNDQQFDLIVSLSFSDNKFSSATSTQANTGGFVGHISYSAVANIKLLKKDGSAIHEKTLILKEDFNSTTQTTAPAAVSAVNSSKAQLEQEYFKRATAKAYAHLNNTYCYCEEYISTSCFMIKEKDFEYSAFNQAYEKIKTAISKQSSGMYLNDEIKTLTEEALLVFISERVTVEPENKKAKYSNENIAGVDYNIAICFFMLRDYENALKYFQLAQEREKLITLTLPTFIESTKELIARKANAR